MNSARILIVEDKAIIAENLEMTLREAGYIICGSVTSGEEALPLIGKENPDIVLMDIQLAGKLDGIQTVERMQEKFSIPVIYLTDFHDKETIDRAKHTQPAAYLLKPFKAKDLLIAIDIAFYNASNGKKAVPAANEKPEELFSFFKDRFFIKEKDTQYRVNIAEILWIEASGSYCTIHTTQKDYTLSISLRVFHERFPHPLLLRIHRSYVVNIDQVTAIRGNMLVVGEKKSSEIPMGESYRGDVMKCLKMI